jgi:hypothetical protein
MAIGKNKRDMTAKQRDMAHRALKRLIRKAGSHRLLGEAIGCTQSNITQILGGSGVLPPAYVPKASELFDEPMWKLRPDLYPRPAGQ